MSFNEIRRSAQERLHRQSGAFDLPSIMIGVAVVAILTVGVLAAIFGVIPWSQDNAAKQDLSAVNTAQGAAYAKDGKFLDREDIINAGWLSTDLPQPLAIDANTDGTCYVAVQEAGTGKQFITTNESTTPRELTDQDTWCNGEKIDPEAVEVPVRPVAVVEPVMVTTWDTSIRYCSSIYLPISGNVNVTIDWGDGSAPQSVAGDNLIPSVSLSHTYAAPLGRTTINIDGTFEKWGEVSWKDSDCLISVDSWGPTGTTSLQAAFYGADNLEHVEEIPSATTNLNYAFGQSGSNPTLGDWDTSNVTDMSRMFSFASGFNQPLDFDTSKVNDMNRMFASAAAFNQPLDFDTSSVTKMEYMFSGATAFNQALDFDTSSVTNMEAMFNYARIFDQPLDFNTSSVTNMSDMFRSTSAFNQPLGFDTSSVTNMEAMFYSAKAFNQDLSRWDVGQVTARFQFDTGATAWVLPKPVFR